MINIFIEVPKHAANLETECREIIVEQPVVQHNPTISKVASKETIQAEPPEFFDPNDPLYGLNERLNGLGLEPETQKVVK